MSNPRYSYIAPGRRDLDQRIGTRYSRRRSLDCALWVGDRLKGRRREKKGEERRREKERLKERRRENKRGEKKREEGRRREKKREGERREERRREERERGRI